jgi:hypothetical protein
MISNERPLSVDENIKREEYSRSLERSIYLKDVSWGQKSRALWLKDGDNNAKFFHRLANSHKRHNSIKSLMVDGHLTDESTVIINGEQGLMIYLFFPLIMGKEYGWNKSLRKVRFGR